MPGSADFNPVDYPQLYDVVVIAGVASPGLCDVECDREYLWDKKTGKGVKGATSTVTGTPVVPIKIRFRLWLREHFLAWASFRNLLKFDYTKDAKKQAVDIYYPSLADIDVNAVVTEKIGAMKHAGEGLYTIDVELSEYQQPPATPALGSPSGASATTKPSPTPPGAPQPPPTLDQLLAQTQQQLNQAQQGLP